MSLLEYRNVSEAESFPADQVRRQLRQETIEGQLAPENGEMLSYVAKCYQTEREDGEDDEHLRARLTAIGHGPKAIN